ncbi:apolipo protein O-domain-containing protein [Peziza echinospora]|nr:apolipo protein O-domain-containing protein [Peziza echinospora]
MAFRPAFRRAFVPLSGVAMAGLVFVPGAVLAEEVPRKKSIYDPPQSAIAPATTSDALTTTTESSGRPTPTERLEQYVRFGRVHINLAHRKLTEQLNTTLNQYLHLENTLTSTISGLLPPPTSSEQPLPGLIYTTIVTLTSTILVRRRAIPIRVLTPMVTAVAAGWYIIPETMGNVAELVWGWEKKVPQVAETHLLVRSKILGGLEDARREIVNGKVAVEEGVRKSRETVEGWVKKG